MRAARQDLSRPTPISSCGDIQPVRALPLIVHLILIWFSAISFLFFGLGCFIAPLMKQEFARYRLTRFRKIVGALQLAGAAGLIAGLYTPILGQLASAGLAVLMLFGVGVRISIRDTVIQTLPAFAYMLLNAYLAIAAYQ